MTGAAFVVTLLVAGITAAGDDSLLRIERRSDADRNALIAAGVTLIAETNDAFLAIGSPETCRVRRPVPGRSTVTVDRAHRRQGSIRLVGLRPGSTETDLLVCGEVIAQGADWRLIKGEGFTAPDCLESPGWFLRVLDMEALAAPGRPHRVRRTHRRLDQVDPQPPGSGNRRQHRRPLRTRPLVGSFSVPGLDRPDTRRHRGATTPRPMSMVFF